MCRVTDSAGDAGPVEIDWGIGVDSAVEGEASVMDMVVEDSAASQESLPSKLLVADFRNRSGQIKRHRSLVCDLCISGVMPIVLQPEPQPCCCLCGGHREAQELLTDAP